ncbi:MAG: DUF192 domain-containing protein [Woeseiaceae bacterium]|nr:DUF192 domain-containing protein [Woeseiaceae bacterium]
MRILFALLAAAQVACSPQTAAPQGGTIPGLDGEFAFGALTVVNDRGERLEFEVYLATDYEQQRRGLMFVRDMPERTGMLFIYETEEIRSMWMKNTYIPLDMIFARADGTVVNVVRDTVPQTLSSNRSTAPARYVLELNGGTARRLGIGTRSRIIREDR